MSIWDFQPMGAIATAIWADFSEALDVKPVRYGTSKMTQRPIVACLSLNGMSAREIHDDITATLRPDAMSYSSVTNYLHKAWFHPSKPEPHTPDVQRDLNDSDQAI
jgi:hypothetical protein